MKDLGGRLFLAVDLSDDLRRALVAHLDGQLPGGRLPGRPVKPERWHLTLKFLGDTAADDATRLVESLAAVDLGPAFELGFGGAGAFPNPKRARVLWLGCSEGAAALTALAVAAESAARAAGFEAESRPFRAHLTLSRLRPARDVRALLEALPAFEGRMAVASLDLIRSHLGRGGPRYERLERWSLESAGGPSKIHSRPGRQSGVRSIDSLDGGKTWTP